jgi:transposase-like protein
MKRKRHTPEEIIKKLREAATLLAGGQGIEEVCKKLEVSPPTYHRWRQEYGGAKEETVKRLKELEKENVQLKKLVADLSLDKAMLKELVEGKWQARRANARRWHTSGKSSKCRSAGPVKWSCSHAARSVTVGESAARTRRWLRNCGAYQRPIHGRDTAWRRRC